MFRLGKGKKNYYAVAIGRQPGIYDEWFGENGAETQVKGFSNAVFKGFKTLDEAKEWLSEIQSVNDDTFKLSEESIPHQKALDEGLAVIYSDGASLGNPGPGGYGVVLLNNKNQRKELSQGYMLTTNNRMELLGCIRGLEALKKPTHVALYTDSRYVVDGIRKGWAKRWQANNWMRSKAKRAKNADLWEQLLSLCTLHQVHFYWVKGHVGVQENERCDELATQSAHQGNLLIDEGFQDPEIPKARQRRLF